MSHKQKKKTNEMSLFFFFLCLNGRRTCSASNFPHSSCFETLGFFAKRNVASLKKPTYPPRAPYFEVYFHTHTMLPLLYFFILTKWFPVWTSETVMHATPTKIKCYLSLTARTEVLKVAAFLLCEINIKLFLFLFNIGTSKTRKSRWNKRWTVWRIRSKFQTARGQLLFQFL